MTTAPENLGWDPQQEMAWLQNTNRQGKMKSRNETKGNTIRQNKKGDLSESYENLQFIIKTFKILEPLELS